MDFSKNLLLFSVTSFQTNLIRFGLLNYSRQIFCVCNYKQVRNNLDYRKPGIKKKELMAPLQTWEEKKLIYISGTILLGNHKLTFSWENKTKKGNSCFFKGVIIFREGGQVGGKIEAVNIWKCVGKKWN